MEEGEGSSKVDIIFWRCCETGHRCAGAERGIRCGDGGGGGVAGVGDAGDADVGDGIEGRERASDPENPAGWHGIGVESKGVDETVRIESPGEIESSRRIDHLIIGVGAPSDVCEVAADIEGAAAFFVIEERPNGGSDCACVEGGGRHARGEVEFGDERTGESPDRREKTAGIQGAPSGRKSENRSV